MDGSPPAAPQPSARWPWQRSLQARILLTYGSVFVVILALLMLVIGRVVYQAQLTTAERALQWAGVSRSQRASGSAQRLCQRVRCIYALGGGTRPGRPGPPDGA